MTLLHQRQQKQMSAIEESQEQETNSVTATETETKSAEVCRELTSFNDKDNDAAAATQTCFTEVTDTLDEAVHFSQS